MSVVAARFGDDLFPTNAFPVPGSTGRRRSSSVGSELLKRGSTDSQPQELSVIVDILPRSDASSGDENDEKQSPWQSTSSAYSIPKLPPGVRRNSQPLFAHKSHTTLLLDWDDTLFPTTWVRNDCGLNWKLSVDDQLEAGPRKSLIKELLAKLAVKVNEFFAEASQCATLFIVTLARRPWVDMSATNFLPDLGRNLEAHRVKVIYAQEYVSEAEIVEYQRDEFLSCQESKDFWTRVKGEAISQELDKFHTENGASWKNVISFGDSDFERFGTMAASEDYMRRELEGGNRIRTGATSEGVSKDGHLKRLRTKTVKMLGEPTIEELTAELAVLTKWVPFMVKQDSGFDIVLDSTEDSVQLQKLHKQITGETATFTWEELAGMASPGK